MDYTKISIITPNFNGGMYLEQTICSVIEQNYPNLEYIIIDGGSTDDSVEIIKKYQDKLAYWVSEKDNGMYDAIQKGFDKSTGEVMGWINSDDKYHPMSFFTIAEIFTSFPVINWLTGAQSFFDEKGRAIGTSPAKKWHKYDFYGYQYKWLQQESTIWRRDLWEKAGSQLNIDLKYAGDLELWLRFFRHEKLYVTNALIGGFRMRSSNQLSLDFLYKYIAEAEDCIKSEPISDYDRVILKKYHKIKKITSFLNKTKVFRTNRFLKIFENKHLNRTPDIVFNRITQKFELKKL